MKLLKTIHIILFISILFFKCTKDENIIKPSDLKSYSKRIFTDIPLQGAKKIQVLNQYGGIIILGWSVENSIRLLLDKTIDAETKDEADDYFDEISGNIEKDEDTLSVSIQAPSNTSRIRYYCSISLDIPYRTDCEILNCSSIIFIDQLDSTLTIHNAMGDVEVSRHLGSCDINTSNNIVVITAMPDSGFCYLTTSSGDIELNIPESTSSTVYANTDNGTVKYDNLTFGDLIESDGFLSGSLGAGEGDIQLETKDGDILIQGL